MFKIAVVLCMSQHFSEAFKLATKDNCDPEHATNVLCTGFVQSGNKCPWNKELGGAPTPEQIAQECASKCHASYAFHTCRARVLGTPNGSEDCSKCCYNPNRGIPPFNQPMSTAARDSKHCKCELQRRTPDKDCV